MDKLFEAKETKVEHKETRDKLVELPLIKGDIVVTFDCQGITVKGKVQWVGKNKSAVPDGTYIVGIYTVSTCLYTKTHGSESHGQ